MAGCSCTWAVLGAIAGCGFHTASSGVAPIDSADAAIDARPDAPDGGPLSSVTATFGERPGADHTAVTSDNSIDASAPAINFGTNIGLIIDATPVIKGLLRFDLSVLPPGTSVASVQLLLTTTSDALDSGTAQIYRILESWDEAASTWTDKQTGMAWANVGADSPGSSGTTLLGEFIPSVPNTEWTVPFDAPTVQGWIDAPSSNRGMILISTSPTGNGAIFFSRDDPTAAARPLLRITYAP